MMKDWNKLTAIEKILRVRGGALKDVVFDEAENELAALRSEIANYETARQEDAKRLEQVTAEREAMREALRQSNETLKVSGMDDIGGGIAKLIEHNTALLKVGKE